MAKKQMRASPTEKIWQAMHLVDVAQTIKGPGEQPSTESVLVWGAAIGVAHYAFDRWMTRTGRADHAGWQLLRYIDLGYKGFTISRNHLGAAPFGSHNVTMAYGLYKSTFCASRQGSQKIQGACVTVCKTSRR